VDSSRGHTVFALTVDQIITGTKKGKPYKQTIKKVMQLVDLAGSERSEKMLSITKEQLQELLNKKAESDGGHAPKVTDKYLARYKEERKAEGTAINTSLSTLGKCVELVAKFASISDAKKRKKKMGQISWRSSQLTRLLRPALSGQSKTIMIAAVSPSTSEYDETLSTMRYEASECVCVIGIDGVRMGWRCIYINMCVYVCMYICMCTYVQVCRQHQEDSLHCQG
jgi:hypothetical protein